MREKEVFEIIIRELAELMSNEGYQIKRKKLSSDKYVVFSKSEEEREFEWQLTFLRYGRVAIRFAVFFKKVNELLLLIDPQGKAFNKEIFSVKILNYLHSENVDDYLHSGFPIDTPCENDIMLGQNLENVSKVLFTRYFLEPIPGLISKLGSLSKAHDLLNGKNTVDPQAGVLNWLLYCPHTIYQIKSSVLVAFLEDKNKLKSLIDFYLEYLSEDEEDDDLDELKLFLKVNLWATTE
ncbi:hypothetical protein [Desertivirga brevis]|uniref:hypothetical protein n=1 Tax=Desertivirga brevis TaxID=2810310 RepID=UPI001A96475F|nr:hypothetical protein [Pedobacter sp. SYSU D00873]